MRWVKRRLGDQREAFAGDQDKCALHQQRDGNDSREVGNKARRGLIMATDIDL